MAGLLALALNIAVRAATADGSNPYSETIAGRNVFSLKTPPPPPNPEDLVKKDPPPKILLQGLTTILGRRQVLYKVQLPAKQGQPAKEESFVAAEGERNGEIEVLQIDENAGVVKFNNHGTIEPKNMKDDVAKALAAPSPPPAQPGVPPPAIPGLPRPTAAVNPANSGASSVTAFGTGAGNIPTRTLRTSATPVGGFGLGPSGQQLHAGPPLSGEEAELMVGLKQMYYQQQNDDRHKILPRTSLSDLNQQPTQPQPEQ